MSQLPLYHYHMLAAPATPANKTTLFTAILCALSDHSAPVRDVTADLQPPAASCEPVRVQLQLLAIAATLMTIDNNLNEQNECQLRAQIDIPGETARMVTFCASKICNL